MFQWKLIQPWMIRNDAVRQQQRISHFPGTFKYIIY